MLDALKIIAPLAGALATGAAVAWGVFKWRNERRAHLDVSVNAGFLVYDGGPGDDLSLIITAVNNDLKPVVIKSVWLEHPDDPQGRRAFIPYPPLGAGIPGGLAGRSSGIIWTPIPSLEREGFAVKDRELVAAVETAAAEIFRSKPTAVYVSDPEERLGA